MGERESMRVFSQRAKSEPNGSTQAGNEEHGNGEAETVVSSLAL